MDPQATSNNSTPAPFQGNDDSPESQIWTAEERRILKFHVEGYRNALRKTKAAYVAKTVIPEIKSSWKGRYDKKNLKKDKGLKKEWDKKKDVRLTNGDYLGN